MLNEFDKAINANVYMFASWKAREVYYQKLERSKPKTLSWFKEKYGVQFCVFEKLKGKGRQRACVSCNECFLRVKKHDGSWLYDDEIDSEDFDCGTVYPVW